MPQLIDHPRHPAARRVVDALRPRAGQARTFVIDDEVNIREAVRQGVLLDSVYATSGAPVTAESLVRSVAESISETVATYEMSDTVAKDVFGSERRSRVFALARPPRHPTLADIVGRPGDVVVLDGVRLVGNIGAITRSACAFGAAGVALVGSGLATTLDRRLVRASRGLVFALPVVLTSHDALARELGRVGIQPATLTTDAAAPLSEIRDVAARLALVVGSERNGVSDADWGRPPLRFTIPTSVRVESLNVSVATALALYEHQQAAPDRSSVELRA